MTGRLPKILLVDDDPADARLIRRAVERGNIALDITWAEDGEVALARLRFEEPYADGRRPDLILLDLNMPKKDGTVVLAEIRADSDLQTIPVVILTTSRADEDVEKSYRLGANAYIAKPQDLHEFAKIIQGIEDFWFSVVLRPPKGG